MASGRTYFDIKDTKRTGACIPDTPYTQKQSIQGNIALNNESDSLPKIDPNARITDPHLGTPSIMLLFDNPVSDGVDNTVHLNKCFCTECRKVFESDDPVSFNAPDPKSVKQMILSPQMPNDGFGREFNLLREQIKNIKCPDCGNEGTYIPVKLDETGKEWHLPEYIRGGWAFETRNAATNAPIRYEANILTQNTIVYKNSGKTFHTMTEYSNVTDLVNNDVRVSKKRSETTKDGKIRFTEKGIVNTSSDPYQMTRAMAKEYKGIAIKFDQVRSGVTNSNGQTYADMYNPIEKNLLGAKASNVKIPLYMSIDTETIWSSKDYHVSPMVQSDHLERWNEMNTLAKKEFIADKFRSEKRINPLYVDWNRNGLFLSEHHPRSTEENTDIDKSLQSKLLSMMIKYPVAFEYACERAEMDLQNEYFDKKRKYQADINEGKEANPPVPPEEMPDSVKCKYFRQEVVYVASQLAAVDSKILSAIHESKNVEDMKAKLQFFAFGDNNTKKKNLQEAQMPKGIRSVKSDENGYENAFDATNQLAQIFRQNPIGVANTAYTCHKIGIKDTALVKQVIDFAQTAQRDSAVSANTIFAVSDKDTLRFLRTYIRDYSPENLLGQRMIVEDIIMNGRNRQFFKDSVNMYTQIKSSPNVVITDGLNSTQTKEKTTQKLRMYLSSQNDPKQAVKNAYHDFAASGMTKDDIDTACREIKYENAMEQIKKYAEQKNINAALSLPDVKEFFEKDGRYKTPEEQAAAIDNYTLMSKRTIEIGTKDNKPLFAGRPLRAEKGHWKEHDLHDELSGIVSKIIDENVEIEYDEREKQLEGSYPASPDTPDIKYSFHLMKDRYDFIRTATELSNCVAGSSYFNNASKEDHDDRTYCMYMADENMNKVACIEISQRKTLNPETDEYKTVYSIQQFESFHDMTLPAEYAYAAVQWLNDKNMRTSTTETDGFSSIDKNEVFSVKEGIQQKYLHGVDADYHNQEIDEVEQIAVKKEKMIQIREEREAAAKAMYPDGIPDPPEDIAGSLDFKLSVDIIPDPPKKSETPGIPDFGGDWIAEMEYDEQTMPF